MDNLDLNDQVIAAAARDHFYTLNYESYKERSTLRADEQVVRAEAGKIVAATRKRIEAAERDYRREFLPPPTRAKPRPDPEAINGAKLLEQISRALAAVQGQLAVHPVPDQHQFGRRFLEQSSLFQQVVELDHRLIGQADLFLNALEGKSGAELITLSYDLLAGIEVISETVKRRQQLLVSLEKLDMR